MASKLSINIFKFLLLSLLFTTFSLAKGTPRLDDVENKLSESERSMIKQELNAQNLQTKINELKAELQKLKDTQDNYRIEKSSYDSKMQNNTDLLSSQNDRFNDITLFFTLFLGLFGIGTYLKSKHDAKETAQEYIEAWIEDKATPHFNKKIDEVLKTKDDEINDLIGVQIKNRVEPMLSSMTASLKDIEAQRDKAKEHIDMLDKVQEEAKSKLEGISKEDLKKIEEKEVTSLTAKDYHTLGWDAIREGKFNTALNEFERSLELVDDDSIGLDSRYFGKAYALDKLKEYQKAIESYNKSLKINPQQSAVYNNMGNTYLKLEKYEKAIELCKKSIEIKPQYDKPYYNMGIAYYQLEKYEKAIEAYKRSIEINPQRDNVYYNMGIAYYWLEKFDESIKSYKKVLTINPNKSSAYQNLFELQLTQNQLFDSRLEAKYIELFTNNQESFIKYEMLKLLEHIANGQQVEILEWKEKYADVGLGAWSFDELHEWINGVEDLEVKEKLREAIEVFEGHV